MIGPFIKDIRNNGSFFEKNTHTKKITLAVLANRIGITHAYLSNVESDKRIPAVKTFFNIIEGISSINSENHVMDLDRLDWNIPYPLSFSHDSLQEENINTSLEYTKKYFREPIFKEDVEKETIEDDVPPFFLSESPTKVKRVRKQSTEDDYYIVLDTDSENVLQGLYKRAFYRLYGNDDFIFCTDDISDSLEDKFLYYLLKGFKIGDYIYQNYKEKYRQILDDSAFEFYYNSYLNKLLEYYEEEKNHFNDKEKEIVETVKNLKNSNQTFKHYSSLKSDNDDEVELPLSQILNDRVVAGIAEHFDLDVFISKSSKLELYINGRKLSPGERLALEAVLNGIISLRKK